MSRRSHFLEADNSSREKNLRFVRNAGDDLQEFFGASGSNNASAPPRDYKVVTPKPGFVRDNSTMDDRKEFFRQLGLPRHEVYEYALRSFETPLFDLDYFEYLKHNLKKQNIEENELKHRILKEVMDILRDPTKVQSDRVETEKGLRRSSSISPPPPPNISNFLAFTEDDKSQRARSRSPQRNKNTNKFPGSYHKTQNDTLLDKQHQQSPPPNFGNQSGYRTQQDHGNVLERGLRNTSFQPLLKPNEECFPNQPSHDRNKQPNRFPHNSRSDLKNHQIEPNKFSNITQSRFPKEIHQPQGFSSNSETPFQGGPDSFQVQQNNETQCFVSDPNNYRGQHYNQSQYFNQNPQNNLDQYLGGGPDNFHTQHNIPNQYSVEGFGQPNYQSHTNNHDQYYSGGSAPYQDRPNNVNQYFGGGPDPYQNQSNINNQSFGDGTNLHQDQPYNTGQHFEKDAGQSNQFSRGGAFNVQRNTNNQFFRSDNNKRNQNHTDKFRDTSRVVKQVQIQPLMDFQKKPDLRQVPRPSQRSLDGPPKRSENTDKFHNTSRVVKQVQIPPLMDFQKKPNLRQAPTPSQRSSDVPSKRSETFETRTRSPVSKNLSKSRADVASTSYKNNKELNQKNKEYKIPLKSTQSSSSRLPSPSRTKKRLYDIRSSENSDGSNNTDSKRSKLDTSNNSKQTVSTVENSKSQSLSKDNSSQQKSTSTSSVSKSSKDTVSNSKGRISGKPAPKFVIPEVFGDNCNEDVKSQMSYTAWVKWWKEHKFFQSTLKHVDDNDPEIIERFFFNKQAPKEYNSQRILSCRKSINISVARLKRSGFLNNSYGFLKDIVVVGEFNYVFRKNYLTYEAVQAVKDIIETLRNVDMIEIYQSIIRTGESIFRKSTNLSNSLLNCKIFVWIVNLAFKELKLISFPILYPKNFREKMKELHEFTAQCKIDTHNIRNPFFIKKDGNIAEFVRRNMQSLQICLVERADIDFKLANTFMTKKLRVYNPMLNNYLDVDTNNERKKFLNSLKKDPYVNRIQQYMVKKLSNIYDRVTYLEAVHPRLIHDYDLKQMHAFREFIKINDVQIVCKHIFDEWIEVYKNYPSRFMQINKPKNLNATVEKEKISSESRGDAVAKNNEKEHEESGVNSELIKEASELFDKKELTEIYNKKEGSGKVWKGDGEYENDQDDNDDKGNKNKEKTSEDYGKLFKRNCEDNQMEEFIVIDEILEDVEEAKNSAKVCEKNEVKMKEDSQQDNKKRQYTVTEQKNIKNISDERKVERKVEKPPVRNTRIRTKIEK